MTGKDAKILSLIMVSSLFFGFAVFIYGASGRDGPPQVDLIWKGVDQIRAELKEGTLSLREGELRERMFHHYHLNVRRFPRDPAFSEAYLLQLRPAYDLFPSTLWRPASWDIAILAEGTGSERKTFLISTRKLKD